MSSSAPMTSKSITRSFKTQVSMETRLLPMNTTSFHSGFNVRSRYAVLRAHPRSFTFSPASFSSQRLTYGSDTFPTSMGSRSSPRVTCTAR